jgi:Uma2 family endonuclease
MAMPLAHRRFTVDEYHRMAEVGILDEDDRVELLDGEIVLMSAMGSRHWSTVARLNERFRDLAGQRAIVSVQLPIRLDRYSEPEPDLALLQRRDDFYAERLPTPDDVLLIVEVADTSQRTDRDRKIPLYAGAGLPEVWLVDLPRDVVDVYRDPAAGAYRNVQTLGRDAVLAVLAMPGVSLQAREVLGG